MGDVYLWYGRYLFSDMSIIWKVVCEVCVQVPGCMVDGSDFICGTYIIYFKHNVVKYIMCNFEDTFVTYNYNDSVVNN